MNKIIAKAILGELLEAYEECEHGDYFYDHGDSVCNAVECVLREQGVTDTNDGNKWISVEERLPDDNEKVIVYTRSGKMCVARWSARQDKFVSSGNLTVTHWMLLPNEPKTEVRCEFAENGVDGG